MCEPTDCFLTHDWGEDMANHRLVSRVNAKLKEKGIVTWFDEEKMDGNVRSKMVCEYVDVVCLDYSVQFVLLLLCCCHAVVFHN